MARTSNNGVSKASQIVGRRSATFGDNQPKKQRMQFGLGKTPVQGDPGTLAAAEKCLRCSFGNIPVIEEVVWTIPLPLRLDEAQATFGETVNLLSGSSSVPGVASIDSTFLINGILQTDILAQGVGVHVFHEPMSFSTIGNAFETQVDIPGSAFPPSPDVFTLNDAANGALGAELNSDNFFPAILDWGDSAWRAGWNFINAYQFQWKTSQRELVLNELAADVSYFGSFADAEAAGTSEVPIIEFVAMVNAMYRTKGSDTIFAPVSFRRVGSITAGAPGAVNTGVFHPTRDFDLAPVTWGGLRWQGYGCRGQMYRPVESPCFLERGIPIGMLFQSQDSVHQARMIEALTITNDPLGTNIQPDENYTCTSHTGASTMLEQTLDAVPTLTPQVVNVCRQVFKGGILKLAIKIKGWEMPGGWKAYCQSNMPQIVSSSSGG